MGQAANRRVPHPYTVVGLCLEGNQQTDNHGEEGDTFDEGSSDNHSGSDITTSFRLTGHTFHCSLTDFTDTQACANSSQACTYGSTHVTPCEITKSLQQYN
mgnify:CR=1 FL=1